MTNILDLETNVAGKGKPRPTTNSQTPQPQRAPIVNGFSQFGLPPFLEQNLSRMGFTEPTTIQLQAIPALMQNQDLVGLSQTGSGKTAAFAVPILARIQRKNYDLQALVMVPTRELALQVTQVFKALSGPAIRVTPIYGGAGMEGQIRGLTQGGYQVVVGTPGRLRDHLNRGTLRLDKIRMLVLDEADEMLDMGFAQDVEAIVQATPPVGKRQTALFSATLPDWVMGTAAKHLSKEHVTISLAPSANSRPDIEQVVYDMTMADKTYALRHLLDNDANGSVLVFARTKHGVKKLAARLEGEGYKAAGLQGNLSQRAREDVVAAFRANRIRIMVATNVGARGLDVSGIGHVINFDLPESPELFTHRVGRTARNGASGTAITFLTGEDRLKWREIERTAQANGVIFTRQAWTGPRAAPGEAPAFTQPSQRTGSTRAYTSPVRPSHIPEHPYRAERGNDRFERGNERSERGNERGERGNERGNDRSNDRSGNDRFERGNERGPADRGNDRFERGERGNERGPAERNSRSAPAGGPRQFSRDARDGRSGQPNANRRPGR